MLESERIRPEEHLLTLSFSTMWLQQTQCVCVCVCVWLYKAISEASSQPHTL